jgi:tRNA pseudouridine55 synthase
MPPRASRPVGIALLDKPAGPSSFALVAELRRRTGARTGHAGTLDPFATGLLVLMSGAATRLAPCFVGLDKRYVTEIDLTATTTTGDPEGEVVERHAVPSGEELDALLEGLRGEVELPVPAHSAVKVGGERAYKLARQGTAVEMPLRRSQVYALDLLARDADTVTLEVHVSTGTYVRSLAQALGGHCRTLRRTSVGPFGVEEADPERLMPVAEALARLPTDAIARVPEAIRARVLDVEAVAP